MPFNPVTPELTEVLRTIVGADFVFSDEDQPRNQAVDSASMLMYRKQLNKW